MRATGKWAEADRVVRVASLSLRVSSGHWQYADHHRDAIDAHWKLAVKANPSFFDGVIHVVDRLEAGENYIEARLIATGFKNFLYWRDEGFPAEGGVRDGFGSALIRSCEGHVLLGRQRPGNINAGLAYLPGGFIDSRDVKAGGVIDMAASIERELREETGLGLDDLTAEPGFHRDANRCAGVVRWAYNSSTSCRSLVCESSRAYCCGESIRNWLRWSSCAATADIAGIAHAALCASVVKLAARVGQCTIGIAVHPVEGPALAASDQSRPGSKVCFLENRKLGGRCRIRTCDPLIKSQLLYQLS